MPSAPTLSIAMLSIHSSPTGSLGRENTGGMSVYVSELARWLGRDGHRIDIFTCVPGAPQVKALHPNVRLIHLYDRNLPMPAKAELPRHLDEAFRLLERFRCDSGITYDLIHSHYWLSGVVGSMARRQWKVPHLITFHTLAAVKNENADVILEPLGRVARERQLVDEADAVIVPVDGEKAHLVDYLDAPPAKVAIIPCGVNLERFQPGDRTAARRVLGLDQGRQIALYVGRFAPLKGVGVLLEALAVLKDERPDLDLVLVGGDGPAGIRDRMLMERAESLGLRGRVVFAGRQTSEKVADYYVAADFLALASHYESFGLVVLEALACGTPVLATPVGVAPAIIAEGVNGTLVEGPEGEAVARGMRRLLDLPAAKRPSQSGVRASAEGLGWDRTARSMVSCYQDALSAVAI